ncbi:MAG: ATP-dependent sacrificial sulfur transferase LarE [Eubacteriales bacterium]|nr:ATP-dependent sacrificial sulfur transferase LarE [Eubacteriales bacterium]
MGKKEEVLRERLLEAGKIAVAYSGGIDSYFLLEMAVSVLGRDHVLAVFCRGAMMPEAEEAEAIRLLELLRVNYRILTAEVLSVPEFASNDKRRCYFCKKYLMGKIQECAHKNGFTVVADGGNVNDREVYRPGLQAVEELGIWSPLAESGFTKADIRRCAKECGLPIWDKPSQACLASRFPYDTPLTAEKLQRAGQAEEILHRAGFRACRVRVHDTIARIEVEREDMERLIRDTALLHAVKDVGFSFVTLDLEGLRSGVFDS